MLRNTLDTANKVKLPSYCISQKSCLFLYRDSLYTNGQAFLDMLYSKLQYKEGNYFLDKVKNMASKFICACDYHNDIFIKSLNIVDLILFKIFE